MTTVGDPLAGIVQEEGAATDIDGAGESAFGGRGRWRGGRRRVLSTAADRGSRTALPSTTTTDQKNAAR